MRVTALDIRNHRFPRQMSGYDREEVDTFLGLIAEDYEAVLRESQAQRDQIVKLEARVEDLASTEDILQQTLTTALRLSDELKRTAVKEAEVRVGGSYRYVVNGATGKATGTAPWSWVKIGFAALAVLAIVLLIAANQ